MLKLTDNQIVDILLFAKNNYIKNFNLTYSDQLSVNVHIFSAIILYLGNTNKTYSIINISKNSKEYETIKINDFI